jgi:hypothetical protein
MPAGWFRGRRLRSALLPQPRESGAICRDIPHWLEVLFAGNTAAFVEWIEEQTCSQSHPFEQGIREADLETIREAL